MKELLTKVPWKKVLKTVAYVGTGVLAVKEAVDKDKDKKVWEAIKKDYESGSLQSK